MTLRTCLQNQAGLEVISTYAGLVQRRKMKNP